jgi:hypothetical protein
VLREMPKPLHLSADTFVFVNQVGRPLDEERFVEKHWHRALRATGVRPRKFYATRHTFISVALSRGANLKWIADYCGTSVEMIERPYGKFLHDDTGQLALLSGPRESPRRRAAVLAKPATLPATFLPASEKALPFQSGGGEIRTPEGFRPWRFSRPLP